MNSTNEGVPGALVSGRGPARLPGTLPEASSKADPSQLSLLAEQMGQRGKKTKEQRPEPEKEHCACVQEGNTHSRVCSHSRTCRAVWPPRSGQPRALHGVMEDTASAGTRPSPFPSPPLDSREPLSPPLERNGQPACTSLSSAPLQARHPNHSPTVSLPRPSASSDGPNSCI